MDVVVRGRNVEVPDHFRQLVEEKLSRLERYDHKIFRVDVELLHERNRRQSDVCQRIEITCRTRGPVVRAEACAADFYAALDQAVLRIERRFSSAADRRRIHHGRRAPVSVAAATSLDSPSASGGGVAVAERTDLAGQTDLPDDKALDATHSHTAHEDEGDAVFRIVRDKEHEAVPMTLDQALFEMELVGHDFYLFADSETGRPSVVYRRKGYAYGVIRLRV